MGISSQFTRPGTTQGGVLNWDPLANIGEENYHNVQAGVSSTNNYAIVKNPIKATLDNVPIGTVNSIISYVAPDGWTIISATTNQAKYTTPASVADEVELNSTFPDPSLHDGEYCYVQSTETYWSPILEGVVWSWYDTNQSTVDSYSKTEIDSIINGVSSQISVISTKLIPYEHILTSPQTNITISHNRNANINNIKFSIAGNNVIDGEIRNYTQIDLNQVNISLDLALPTGTKIVLNFSLT